MKKRMWTHNVFLYFFLVSLLCLLVACTFPGFGNNQADQNHSDQNDSQAQQNEEHEDLNQDQQDSDSDEEINDNNEDPGVVQGRTGQWVSTDYGGFGFWYNPAVIEEIQPSTVSQSVGGMYQIPHPPYVHYDMPLDNGAVSVVEIPWYIDMSEAAAEIFPELQALLATQSAQGLECIPELPLLSAFRQCDHQQFHGSLAFINFPGGSGVRFVSVYGIQDAVPVSNADLVYVFQGITDDGNCYVQATFPLTHKELEELADFPEDVYSDTSGELLSEYFADFQTLLEENPDGFIPPLDRFDLIIQSIEVAACQGG